MGFQLMSTAFMDNPYKLMCVGYIIDTPCNSLPVNGTCEDPCTAAEILVLYVESSVVAEACCTIILLVLKGLPLSLIIVSSVTDLTLI